MTDANDDASYADDDIPQDGAWFRTEASGFMGRHAREDALIRRVALRMRRRVRPEQLISNGIFGLIRHATTAALYLAIAYAAKLALGISLVFNAVR
jgi:hypothetical protein